MSQDTAQTRAVFDHHMQVYLARDLDGIMTDYTGESVLIVNMAPEPFRGLAAIRGLYAQAMEMLTPDALAQFKITHRVIDGEVAYMVFSAGTVFPFATDTFVIRGGKIAVQTATAYFPQGS